MPFRSQCVHSLDRKGIARGAADARALPMHSETAGASARWTPCFDIERELAYWLERRHEFTWAAQCSSADIYLQVVRFSYDCYLFHGRESVSVAWPSVRNRYERSSLYRECDWWLVDRLSELIWRRMRQELPCEWASRAG